MTQIDVPIQSIWYETYIPYDGVDNDTGDRVDNDLCEGIDNDTGDQVDNDLCDDVDDGSDAAYANTNTCDIMDLDEQLSRKLNFSIYFNFLSIFNLNLYWKKENVHVS